MTIKFYSNRIEFGDYTLTETPTGFSFNGEALGRMFISSPQGTVAGFQAGGLTPVSDTSRIDKYPFAVDATATTIGNINSVRRDLGGASSSTHGYVLGGYSVPSGFFNSNEKFQFSSGASISVYALTNTVYGIRGAQSSTHGYALGGGVSGIGIGEVNTIDKFSFAVDGNASDIGDLTAARGFGASQSSTTHGYVAGGNISGLINNSIEKVPFATDGNSSDVADLSTATRNNIGVYSFDHGYSAGGTSATDYIDRFPFAADANATDVGQLTTLRENGSGASSVTHGYIAGGNTPSGYITNIEKFNFNNESIVTSVGTFAGGTAIVAGTGFQY